LTSPRLRYVPGLDGLRALAVGGVLLFHLRLPGTMLGWTGVQLFFVISGFLITRILLDSRGTSHPFRSFYVRRALRIFPIYYLYLLLLVVLHGGTGATAPLRFLPLYATYTHNIPAVLLGDGLLATSHTWSLAVEEQFYWLWPLAILLLPRRSLRFLIIGLLVAAPLWRAGVVLIGANPLLASATLPSQIDSIAAGAAIALAYDFGYTARTIRRIGWVGLSLGASLVTALTLVIGLDSFWDWNKWSTAGPGFLYLTGIAIVSGSLIALVVAGAVPRFLRWRSLKHIGRISYGIYLYHALVFYAVATNADAILAPTGLSTRSVAGRLIVVVLSLGATVTMAALSWRVIEAPLLAVKDRLTIARPGPVTERPGTGATPPDPGMVEARAGETPPPLAD